MARRLATATAAAAALVVVLALAVVTDVAAQTLEPIGTHMFKFDLSETGDTDADPLFLVDEIGTATLSSLSPSAAAVSTTEVYDTLFEDCVGTFGEIGESGVVFGSGSVWDLDFTTDGTYIDPSDFVLVFQFIAPTDVTTPQNIFLIDDAVAGSSIHLHITGGSVAADLTTSGAGSESLNVAVAADEYQTVVLRIVAGQAHLAVFYDDDTSVTASGSATHSFYLEDANLASTAFGSAVAGAFGAFEGTSLLLFFSGDSATYGAPLVAQENEEGLFYPTLCFEPIIGTYNSEDLIELVTPGMTGDGSVQGNTALAEIKLADWGAIMDEFDFVASGCNDLVVEEGFLDAAFLPSQLIYTIEIDTPTAFQFSTCHSETFFDTVMVLFEASDVEDLLTWVPIVANDDVIDGSDRTCSSVLCTADKLPAGTYYLAVLGKPEDEADMEPSGLTESGPFKLSFSIVPDPVKDCLGFPDGPAQLGGACDDSISLTINDVYVETSTPSGSDAYCVCSGTIDAETVDPIGSPTQCVVLTDYTKIAPVPFPDVDYQAPLDADECCDEDDHVWMGTARQNWYNLDLEVPSLLTIEACHDVEIFETNIALIERQEFYLWQPFYSLDDSFGVVYDQADTSLCYGSSVCSIDSSKAKAAHLKCDKNTDGFPAGGYQAMIARDHDDDYHVAFCAAPLECAEVPRPGYYDSVAFASENGGTPGVFSPLANYYVEQNLYTAHQLAAAGHTPGTIFNTVSIMGGAALDPALTANVQLAVAFVSENMPDLDARFKRDMMVVFPRAPIAPTGEDDWIEFSTANFEWDGVSNLILEVSVEMATSGTPTSSVGGAGYAHVDNPSDGSGARLSFRGDQLRHPFYGPPTRHNDLLLARFCRKGTSSAPPAVSAVSADEDNVIGVEWTTGFAGGTWIKHFKVAVKFPGESLFRSPVIVSRYLNSYFITAETPGTYEFRVVTTTSTNLDSAPAYASVSTRLISHIQPQVTDLGNAEALFNEGIEGPVVGDDEIGVMARYVVISKSDMTVNPEEFHALHLGEIEVFEVGAEFELGLDPVDDYAIALKGANVVHNGLRVLGSINAPINGEIEGASDAFTIDLDGSSETELSIVIDLGTMVNVGRIRVWQPNNPNLQRLKNFNLELYDAVGAGSEPDYAAGPVYSSYHAGAVAEFGGVIFPLSPRPSPLDAKAMSEGRSQVLSEINDSDEVRLSVVLNEAAVPDTVFRFDWMQTTGPELDGGAWTGRETAHLIIPPFSFKADETYCFEVVVCALSPTTGECVQKDWREVCTGDINTIDNVGTLTPHDPSGVMQFFITEPQSFLAAGFSDADGLVYRFVYRHLNNEEGQADEVVIRDWAMNNVAFPVLLPVGESYVAVYVRDGKGAYVRVDITGGAVVMTERDGFDPDTWFTGYLDTILAGLSDSTVPEPLLITSPLIDSLNYYIELPESEDNHWLTDETRGLLDQIVMALLQFTLIAGADYPVVVDDPGSGTGEGGEPPVGWPYLEPLDFFTFHATITGPPTDVILTNSQAHLVATTLVRLERILDDTSISAQTAAYLAMVTQTFVALAPAPMAEETLYAFGRAINAAVDPMSRAVDRGNPDTAPPASFAAPIGALGHLLATALDDEVDNEVLGSLFVHIFGDPCEGTDCGEDPPEYSAAYYVEARNFAYNVVEALLQHVVVGGNHPVGALKSAADILRFHMQFHVAMTAVDAAPLEMSFEYFSWMASKVSSLAGTYTTADGVVVEFPEASSDLFTPLDTPEAIAAVVARLMLADNIGATYFDFLSVDEGVDPEDAAVDFFNGIVALQGTPRVVSITRSSVNWYSFMEGFEGNPEDGGFTPFFQFAAFGPFLAHPESFFDLFNSASFEHDAYTDTVDVDVGLSSAIVWLALEAMDGEGTEITGNPALDYVLLDRLLPFFSLPFSLDGEGVVITLPLDVADGVEIPSKVTARFWDPTSMDWMDDGVEVLDLDLDAGTVTFETTHLTAFAFTDAFDACDFAACADYSPWCDQCITDPCCVFCRPSFECRSVSAAGSAGCEVAVDDECIPTSKVPCFG